MSGPDCEATGWSRAQRVGYTCPHGGNRGRTCRFVTRWHWRSLRLFPGTSLRIHSALNSQLRTLVLGVVCETLPRRRFRPWTLFGAAAVRHQVEADGYATLATERTTAPRKAVARRRQPSWAGE